MSHITLLNHINRLIVWAVIDQNCIVCIFVCNKYITRAAWLRCRFNFRCQNPIFNAYDENNTLVAMIPGDTMTIQVANKTICYLLLLKRSVNAKTQSLNRICAIATSFVLRLLPFISQSWRGPHVMYSDHISAFHYFYLALSFFLFKGACFAPLNFIFEHQN